MSRLPVEVVEWVIPARRVRTTRGDRISLRWRFPPVVTSGTQGRWRTYFWDFVCGRYARITTWRRNTRRRWIRTTHCHIARRSNYGHRPGHRWQRRRRKHRRREILGFRTSRNICLHLLKAENSSFKDLLIVLCYCPSAINRDLSQQMQRRNPRLIFWHVYGKEHYFSFWIWK